MLVKARGDISDSAAWELIIQLRRDSRYFICRQATPPAASSGRARTRDFVRALGALDVEIWTTFTSLDLELLFALGKEPAVDTSGSGAEQDSGSGEDSSTDSKGSAKDDASSVSSTASAGSRRLASVRPLSHTSTYSARPSSQALRLLQSLCSLLEARVNPVLVSSQPELPDEATIYPAACEKPSQSTAAPTPPHSGSWGPTS